MSEKIDSLMDKFFDYVRQKAWPECESIIDQFAHLQDSASAPSYADSWSIYLSSVLKIDRDGDPGAAENLLLDLVDHDLPPQLIWRVYNELAILNGMTDQHEASIDWCIKALDSIPASRIIDRIKIINNLAINYDMGYGVGDFDSSVLSTALDLLEDGMALLNGLPNSDTNVRQKIEMLNTYSSLLRYVGQLEKAQQLSQQKIELCQAFGHQQSEMISWNNLGEIFHAKGPAFWDKAREAYDIARVMAKRLDRDWSWINVDILANLGYLYQGRNDAESLHSAMDYYEQAIVGLEQLRAGITGAPARSGFLSRVSSIYELAILHACKLERFERAFELMEQARSRSFREILARKEIKLPSQFIHPPLKINQIQQALSSTDVILAYFTTGQKRRVEDDGQKLTPSRNRHRLPEPNILLFALTSSSIDVFDLEVSPNDIQPIADVPSFLLKEPISSSMYNLLIQPAAASIEGKDRIYFMPHGPVHTMPLHALTKPDGTRLLHLKGPLIMYSPSGSILFQEEVVPTEPPSLSCFAIGYNGHEDDELTEAERSAVHTTSKSMMNGKALVGPTSKIEALTQMSYGYRYLHFSCHGKFDIVEPLQSSLLIGPQEYLTAEKIIADLKINADLVVLSACDSGLNQIHRGDEHDGLVRAFMIAGAKMVLTANWKVRDKSTAILIHHFFSRLNEGAEPAQALKDAQLYIKDLTIDEAREICATIGLDPIPREREGHEIYLKDENEIHWAAFNLKVRSQT